MVDATAAQQRHPVSKLDPFCPAFLSDPYPFHEQLREAGPAVWLERYGVWAMARPRAGARCAEQLGNVLLERRRGPQRFP